MRTHLAILTLALLLLISACGGGTDSIDSSSATTVPPTTTTAVPASLELGPIGSLLADAFVDEGFSEEEAECLGLGFTDEFGETGLQEMMTADEEPPGFEEAMENLVLECLSAERIVELGVDEPIEVPYADLSATLTCSDTSDDIRSEFSGWTPSIPWGMGDVAQADLTVENGELTVTIWTQGTYPPTGGPGETPFVVRMYLVTGNEQGPVAYDVELMRSDNEDDSPGPILVTTVDGQTGEFLTSYGYDDVYTGPGMITATIPASAVEEVITDDFWVEIRTEWGPDRPIGSNDEPEWMIDSACNGPQYVEVTNGQSEASLSSPPWSPKTVDELIDPTFLVDVGFGYGLPAGWYEEVWMKPSDSGGEVAAGQGVRFTGLGGSTRSGIMTDVNANVDGYPHLVVALHGTVLEQSLSGTGWYGREAPLAVAVTYVDAAGTKHVGLSEDPTAPTNMLYVGFTALPEPDMFNGIEVTIGEPFVYQFDLMELDPAPVEILSLIVEGSGWDPRVGEVYEVMLAAGN
jgi:hypothetical protein